MNEEQKASATPEAKPAAPVVVKATLHAGHRAERAVELLEEDNADLIGPGKVFASKRAFHDWFFEHNKGHFIALHGSKCNPKDHRTWNEAIKAGTDIDVPAGFKLDKLNASLCGEPLPKAVAKPIALAAAAPAPAPVAAAPDRVVKVENPTEYARQSTPSDGKTWPVGSERWALELYARSGVNPEFTKKYYALTGVAARQPVIGAGDSGQTYGFEKEGPNVLGENPESAKDDNTAQKGRYSTGGDGLVQEMINGPRQRGNVNGEIEKILPDGTMVRRDHMNIQFAHGGNPAFTLGITIPVPFLSEVPVGALATAPNSQVVLPAETKRWGITQAVHVMSRLNEAGYDGIFRDEQSKITNPLETPDRIVAAMFRENASKEFVTAMRDVDKQTDPAQKEAAAERALVAWRDYSDNKLIRRVDSMKEPLEQGRQGILRHFHELGMDENAIARIQDQAAKAPRLDVKDMPQELLEQQQDYKALKDDRYKGIAPGTTNAAYAAGKAYAYGNPNLFEQEMSLGRFNDLSEPDMIMKARGAMGVIFSSPESVRQVGKDLQVAGPDHRGLRQQAGMLLEKMRKSPENFIPKDSKDREADIQKVRDLTDQLLAGDKNATKQVDRDGGTTPLPFIGADGPYKMTDPEVLRVVGASIERNPELGARLFDWGSDPTRGVDSKGRSDGRRFTIGVLREYGAEMLPDNGKEGDAPPAYSRLAATIKDPQDKATLHDAVLDAVAYGETGQRGLKTKGVQRLDNQYDAAERARRGQVIVNDKNLDSTVADLKKDATGDAVTVFNTGAFDATVVADAARKGDMQTAFNEMFLSPEARAAGSDQVLIKGLKSHPAWGRDAILLTILREPNSLNDGINELHNLQKSDAGRYGELAHMLERTRDAAEKFRETGDTKYRDRAVQSYGAYFSDMAAHDGDRQGRQRMNAWEGFLDAVGSSKNATPWVLDTVSHDAALRDSALAGVPDAIAATDGTQHTPNAGIPGQRVASTDGDAVYSSRFFALPTDKEGKVHARHFFGLLRNDVKVNSDVLDSSLAGATVPPSPQSPQVQATLPLPAGVDPATANAAKAAAGPLVGGVSNADKAFNTGMVIVPTAGKSPADSLAAYMQSTGIPLPEGVKSYAELAQASLAAGMVKVSPDGASLVATPKSEALESTLAEGASLSAAAGIAKWWLLLALEHDGKGNTPENKPITHEQVPGRDITNQNRPVKIISTGGPKTRPTSSIGG